MKRGYAVSGMLYTLLVLFMVLLLSFLYSMQNKKNILDKLKTDIVEAFYCENADNIEDLRGQTLVATSVTKSGDNALIQIPKEGHYDTTSYLSVPLETIKNEIDVGLNKLGSISCAAGSSCTYTISSETVVNNYLVVCTGVNAQSASGTAGVSSLDDTSLSNQKVSASITKMSYTSTLSDNKITITVSGGRVASSSNLAGSGGSFNPTFTFDIYSY